MIFKKTTVRSLLLFSMMSIMLFSSCTVERKLANHFVKHTDKVAMMVLFPKEVFAVNEKAGKNPLTFFFEEAKQDTSLFRNSLILKELNDEKIITPFRSAYVNELKNYGFKVFEEDQMDDFHMVESEAFMMNLAQLEIQEYRTVYQDAIVVGETTYTKDIWLNGINIAAWFELNQFNDEFQEKPKVLFATHDQLDNYVGYFVQKFFTGEIEYRLTIDTMTVENVNSFTSYLGRLYAAYTFDYLMNNYILNNTAESQRTNRYFRFDPYRRMFFFTEDDKFTELE
jgi:hypothetical protein